jgi:hypothetical protein
MRAVAAARGPGVVAWAPGGAVVYGAACALAVVDARPSAPAPAPAVTALLRGHVRPVTAVAAVGTRTLASGGADGAVHLWALQRPLLPSSPPAYAPAGTLPGHTDAVVALAGYTSDDDDDAHEDNDERDAGPRGDGGRGDSEGAAAPDRLPLLLVATASVDGTVRVWRRVGNGEPEMVQVLQCGTRAPLALAWAKLPDNDRTSAGLCTLTHIHRERDRYRDRETQRERERHTHTQTHRERERDIHACTTVLMHARRPRLRGRADVVLAVGGVDCRVHLWVAPRAAPPGSLVRAVSLSGHEDWVRGIAFLRHGPLPPLPCTSAAAPRVHSQAHT